LTTDEQEALSQRYGNDIILVLPLRSGNVAVFNSARDLCGIVETPRYGGEPLINASVYSTWFPPNEPKTFTPLNLEELDL